MVYQIEVPEYSGGHGLRFIWEDGFSIEASIQNGCVLISANKQGLVSLARHLLALSQDSIPEGWHFHLDSSNSLEDGSCEIIFERK